VTVYLVPVGDRRYQLYVEIPPEAADADSGAGERPGFINRQVTRFRTMLAEAEQARLKRERGEPEESTGLWQKIMRRVAETVAEQRLLWHLRQQTSATVLHPDDIDGAAALAEVRAEFTRDTVRHRAGPSSTRSWSASPVRFSSSCQGPTSCRGISRFAPLRTFCPGAAPRRA
jgi:hypothetical protein